MVSYLLNYNYMIVKILAVSYYLTFVVWIQLTFLHSPLNKKLVIFFFTSVEIYQACLRFLELLTNTLSFHLCVSG